MRTIEMKRYIRIVLILVSIAVSVLSFWFWAKLRFNVALLRLSVSKEGVPMYANSKEGAFSVNTYSDEVSSATIGDLYYSACKRLEHLRGSFPRRTYYWYDALDWDRITSVVQFPDGYIAVTAACNNDNDSVSVQINSGTFPPAGHSPRQFLGLKERPDDQLPAGLLRFQQGEGR